MPAHAAQDALDQPGLDGTGLDRTGLDRTGLDRTVFGEELAGTRDLAPQSAARQSAEVRRRELAGFLRSRRERIAPELVGLPPAPRRRTPGLRREEVATLAGVGVTWYTWLEQGRDINASPQVLDAVARTLLLDPHERDHLFRLADVADGSGRTECSTLPPTAQALLDKLEPYPACIRNARYDILAYNAAFDRLMGPLDELPFEERNSLWRMFTVPKCRAATLDWEEGTRRMVAEYRAAMAEHIAEPAWKCLVTRLTKASPEFAELWERHEVASPENLTKRFLHPEVGLLKLNYTHLWLGQRLGTRMTTYTPTDELTMERLTELHERAQSA
jgi:transcriptional regulator with XRE-family HTH domain